MPHITWMLPATVAAGAVVLYAGNGLVCTVRDIAGRPRPEHTKPSRGWLRILLAVIVVIAACLAPVFFLDMFFTVTHLLGGSFHGWAWTVPAATEGSFVVLYLLDLYLQRRGKPMGWLRYAPYPFAAASVFLNVWSSWGDIPAMLGHVTVTAAFFLPLLAMEAAVRSLSVSEADVKDAAELADARRYALDLVRDRAGRFWRFRRSVPSLLKRQILRSRPPAAVVRAVKDGAQFGGAEKWEAPVEKWVTDGLTQGVKVAAAVTVRKRAIERQAKAQDDGQDDRQKPPPKTVKKQVSATVRKQAEVKRLLTVTPALTNAEIMRRAGVSESTVIRAKKQQPERRLESVN